jgi:hypothetical protein
MTSKEEIKNAFIAELKNTPQYQIILTIKDLIMNEIVRPNVQQRILYNFDRYVENEEQEIIKMCSIVEFGFEPAFINESFIDIQMKNFLI